LEGPCQPLEYELKVQTINGFIDTQSSHLSGECSEMSIQGTADQINTALATIKVRPACDAPGAMTTYVIDISSFKTT